MELSDSDRADLHAALDRMGLGGPRAGRVFTPLVGGVSSLIVRVDTADSPFCIKKALPQLRVAAVWHAPVARNAAEVDWIRRVSGLNASWVPAVLGHDRVSQTFAMQYLPPDEYPVWKGQLRDGLVDPSVAEAVGSRLGQIHAATANHAKLAEQFAHQDQFYALRLEPYFVEAGRRHPQLAPTLEALVKRTYGMRRALVHGDVSPKNILVGPHGPVFLDAECAVYGDPAFDLAFCLNHLLLKCVWRRSYRGLYLGSFSRLLASYMPWVSWEPLPEFSARVAELLAAMLLARVDGKSPVEYLTAPEDQAEVRAFAISHIQRPSISPDALLDDWSRTVCLP
ncbi:MAG: phosphotransferase family protein [Burkholderiaceae bacterium]